MQKTSRKKRVSWTATNLTKTAHHLAVHTDSNSHLSPTLRLERGATLSIANRTRGTHFIFGPVAAVTALRLAQIETQTQIALQQLAILASIIVGNQCRNSDLAAALPPHLALLGLLNRQVVSAGGLNSNTNRKNSTFIQPGLSAAMYYQHPQQQGSQPFPNAPRPSQHQPPPNQLPNHPNMQAMSFQFPRPTQLPDELESALAIRGVRDVDHRQIDHLNQPNQGSGSVIGQQGGCGPNPIALTADSQPGHQQGVDWSSYQPPTKLFANPPPNPNPQGTQQPPQNRQSHGVGVGGEGHGLYTPESAGSILASFGLSNEDLEVLSHYPDDQLTPDTLPFILRDIQINKSGKQKTAASASSSSFSRSIHDVPVPSQSPEVPSLLTVTQTAGKVIDYGHASRGNDESTTTRERVSGTFKREPLLSERTVQMYPASSSIVPKVDKTESREVHLEHKEPNKHGDQDYRRTSSKKRRRSRSPETKFSSSPNSRNLDRDYRHDGSKQRPSSESRSKVSSRQPLSSSSGSRPHGIGRKLPTTTMISDFAAVPPKVYPHTCSLCNIQCDEEKDWVDHVNTVNHTSACRDLRNKYPHWKPNLPSRSGRYGSRSLWDPKDGSPFHSISQSLSRTPSPPQGKYRMDSHPLRHHGRSYSPHRHQRQTYTERSHRFDRHHSRSHSPSYKRRTPSSSRESWPERRSRESSGGFSRGVKRPHDDLSKGGPSQPSTKATKGTLKSGSKTTKMSLKPPPAKKKKKKAVFQDVSAAHRLVYLTGIPVDASEQEVTDLVRSFGKINNVILMSCSEEESEKSQGQKASVCMMTAEDAQALASSKTLSIRDQEITASVATKLDNEQSPDTNSITAPEQDKSKAGNNSAADGANQKTTDQHCKVLITGLPENSCSESDIIQLVQPSTTPCDIILAAHLGKALVSLPDLEVAQELVKVHSFKPANVNDSEVKIALLKRHVGLDTPVALYNIFVGPADLLEDVAPVSWNTLLVIRNVPNTPSGPSEVLKLVRRFGTVINTLVLNSMVICEMATSAMAFSVFKRFQMFPCIIHNNPLFFSRKPDRKATVQSKASAASGDSAELIPEKGGESQPAAAAADEDRTAGEENSEPPLEDKEEDGDEKDNSRCGDESLGENESSVKKEENAHSDVLATQSTEADAGLVTEMTEAPAVEAETAEVNKTASDVDMSSVGGETKPSDDNEISTSQETAMPELPKMTQAMVNALLVECRTRTASHPNNTATPSSGEQKEAPGEMEQGEKAAEKTKEAAKNSVEEEGMKKQERERRETEARKEKETREKERRERERRALERERDKREKERADRAKRERDRREEERRDWERRERERRDRKRSYDEGYSGSRSYHRSKGYRHSSWRDEHAKEEEEELDDFPFNMSDFVTVDEVGDVTDLPQSPSPNVPVETLESEDGALTSGQQDTPEDVEVTEPQANSEEQLSESERAIMSAAQISDVSARAELTLSLDLDAAASVPPASQIDSSSSGTPNPNLTLTCQSEAPQPDIKPEPDTSVTTTLDSTSDVEPVSTPVPAAASDSSSTSPAEGGMSAESQDENKNKTFPLPNNKEMLDVSIKQEENEQMQENDNNEAIDANEEAGNLEEAQDQNTKEKSLETKSQMDTATKTDPLLLPYDPNKPIGMEYLVPKTGFFCKVCGRFFSGAKLAQISHCKTLKHYENLQKCFQTTDASVAAVKMDSN